MSSLRVLQRRDASGATVTVTADVDDFGLLLTCEVKSNGRVLLVDPRTSRQKLYTEALLEEAKAIAVDALKQAGC